MKPNDMLSIIVPVFNGEKYIKKTIKNLLNASYQNLELLLIDDGSTDRSLEICKQYEKSDSRIKVYHKNNGGIADARNYGLDQASGSYVGFCDQDDTVSPEMYRRMMDRIEKDGSDAAICGCYRKKPDGKSVVFEQYTDAVLSGGEIWEKLLFPLLFRGFAVYENKEITIFPSIWTCIISKKLIDEKHLRFHSFVDHEDDLIMLVKLYLNAQKVSTLSGIFYYWNTNTGSETYRRRNRRIHRLEEKQKKRTEYMKKELGEKGIAKEIVDKYEYTLCCLNVLQILDNLCLSKESLFDKMKYLGGSESVFYVQSKEHFVPPQKGFVRNTRVIALIRKKQFYAAYALNKGINTVRYIVERHRLAESLERSIKR